MPQFYFHVCDGEGYARDDEGQDLEDTRLARAVALKSARELMAEEIKHGVLRLASYIDVEAETGQTVFRLTFAEAVVVVNPENR